ncbi:MAG: NAD(P)H-dependent oxidoreductase, partial [Actinomycetota bacterium]
CDTLVIVYPTWWSAQPAILKGWFDRVWISGVAWELPPGANRIRPLLHNIRRIVVITAHGSGRLTNLVEGRVGKRTIGRGLRAMCHPLARTQWTACYDMDRNSNEDRERFLRRLDRL